MAHGVVAVVVKDWVLLRGLSREQRHWGVFLALLRAVHPNLRFHCIDLPGTGDAVADRSPTTVPAIRRYLQARCSQHGISARFGIIGLSMGGMLALDWMAASEQVAGVVVINTSATDCPLWQRLQPACWLRVLSMICRSDIAARERQILQMGSRYHGDDAATLAQWVAIQQQRPVSLNTVARQLLAASGFSLPANARGTNGLVLCSGGDAMVANHCSELIALRYGWPLRREDSAGHDLPLDCPQWVVSQFGEWLQAMP